ncbi:hypothetical protein PoB_006739900 [Plakobranchus ocellatus]|uniref:Mitochondrial pyruvate carrier n=1 Tax=Plakobranchus ocellatus TaxID=259542 RepID=A0AAV4D9N7_9GAST|nr:hypothetical protein PoB_006739900 [Plakobranchus ocellatus]
MQRAFQGMRTAVARSFACSYFVQCPQISDDRRIGYCFWWSFGKMTAFKMEFAGLPQPTAIEARAQQQHFGPRVPAMFYVVHNFWHFLVE